MRRRVRRPVHPVRDRCSRRQAAGSSAAHLGIPANQTGQAPLQLLVRPGNGVIVTCVPAGQAASLRRPVLEFPDTMSAQGVPAGQTGSIAAPRTRPRSASRPRVPVFPRSGGLHCGWLQAMIGSYGQSVLPPVSGGLHCGAESVYLSGSMPLCSRWLAAGSIAACSAEFLAEVGQSSCRPSAGSIVARNTRRSPATSVPCSRRSTAGSIAAGHPSRSRPLWLRAFPSVSGGLYCGGWTQPSSRRGRSYPAVDGGLHCGDNTGTAGDFQQAQCSHR